MPPAPRIDITPAQEALAPVEPCTLVIFGGSGDLARRRLSPALYNFILDELLPANFAVLGLGRKSMTDDDVRPTLSEAVLTHSRQPWKEDRWSVFAERLFYLAGGNEDRQTYTALKARVEDIERQFGLPGNRIFYLSIPPSSFTAVCEGLEHSELAVHRDRPYARIIVEKPVGRDLSSAQQINAVTGRVFDESQIFRIDHYLGKETVQNLMVVRFANSIFEPIWNHKYIDHVQITVSETEGVGTRAAYYEEAGALRDMVQNHLLQLLCLVAMEPPYSLDPDVVRNAKMEVLRCLRPITGNDVEAVTVRAQYAGGTVACKPVPGYRREPGVKPDSTTETYVALKCFVENWRWSGVPFYLRIVSRVPGTREQTHPVEMAFKYAEVFGRPSPEAYERLLLDVMAGDASRFMRRDAVEASWAWITEILEGWHRQGLRWLPEYPAGTCGPVEANRLIEK